MRHALHIPAGTVVDDEIIERWNEITGKSGKHPEFNASGITDSLDCLGRYNCWSIVRTLNEFRLTARAHYGQAIKVWTLKELMSTRNPFYKVVNLP